MAITNINPAQNNVIAPGDSFSFDIDNTYTALVVKVAQTGGDEYAYDYALGGAQAGYTVSITDLGGKDRIAVSRDAGWNKEPTTVSVTENETGSSVTTSFTYYLTTSAIYPEGMQPYNNEYDGSLIVTEENVSVRSDVGWIDFDGASFNLTDMGNGKVRVVALGSGSGSGGGGLGDWTYEAGTGATSNEAFRANSATVTSITTLYVDDNPETGGDFSTVLGLINEGDYIVIRSADGLTYGNFLITATPTDQSGYWQFTGTTTGTGTLSAGSNYSFNFVREIPAKKTGIGHWVIGSVSGGLPGTGEISLSSAAPSGIPNTQVDHIDTDGNNFTDWFDQISVTGQLVLRSIDGTKTMCAAISSSGSAGGVYSWSTGGTSSGSGPNFVVGEVVTLDVLPQAYNPVALDQPGFGFGTWIYDDSSTSTVGLASGNMRFNNADPALATECYIWESCREGMTFDFQDWIGDRMTMTCVDTAYKSLQFTIGYVTPGTNKYTIQLLSLNGSGSWPTVGTPLVGVDVISASGSGGGAATGGGFVDTNDVTLAWTVGTRTLDLTGTYSFYAGGAKYTETNDSIVIADTEGPKWVYYDTTGTLTVASAFSDSVGGTPDMREVCLVAGIYWNATDNQAEPQVVEMLYNNTADPDWRRQCLRTEGSRYLRGGTPTSFVFGDGSLATHAQFSVSGSAQMYIADKYTDINSRAVGDAIPKLWRQGTSSGGFWRSSTSADSYVVETTGTGRAGYDYLNVGSWALTECTDGYYLWSHVCALPGIGPNDATYVIVVGRDEYAGKKEAEDNVIAEVSSIRNETTNGFLHSHLLPIMSILCQTKTSYTNVPNTRTVQLLGGDYYLDHRNTHYPISAEASSTTTSATYARAINDRYIPNVTTSDPGAGDDLEDGYFVGAIWVNTTTGDCFICVDASLAAADWRQIAT